ncbi:cyun99 [Cyclophragma undans nucleopolyhedrovirus]|uniref:Cyun99 n=1 Tax=Cyclophragma undans nucleopolyhedrovirus TaxID=1906244 RepID=A0A288QPV4_9ABAC|nr:cyun99 [Cyclophragma undans nucleopolyhedrovirus]AOT85557.1 cyun99 [Cyclophragma undans nucleopolyhedrovirus]
MTWPYSKSFKLIKAYQRYSRLYTSCTNAVYKNAVFLMWLRDVVDESLLAECKPYQNDTVYCHMCVSVVKANDYLCCDRCLFPIVDKFNKFGEQHNLTSRQHLYVFALLSVCFWKEIKRGKSSSSDGGGDSNAINIKAVWKHRLRIAWISVEHPFVCRLAKTALCLQCALDNMFVLKRYYCSDKKLSEYNDDYFCHDCLFPLFDKLIFIYMRLLICRNFLKVFCNSLQLSLLIGFC